MILQYIEMINATKRSSKDAAEKQKESDTKNWYYLHQWRDERMANPNQSFRVMASAKETPYNRQFIDIISPRASTEAKEKLKIAASKKIESIQSQKWCATMYNNDIAMEANDRREARKYYRTMIELDFYHNGDE